MQTLRTPALECNDSLIKCLSPLAVEAVDGRSLGTGKITSNDNGNSSSRDYSGLHNFNFACTIILGLPWLRKHNHISIITIL